MSEYKTYFPRGTAGSRSPREITQPVALRYRHDGWTPERQIAFIEKLADCGSVTAAASMSG